MQDQATPKENLVHPALGIIPEQFTDLDGEKSSSDLPTLAKVGQVLPIGFRDQTGTVHREFELVPWTWDLEEALGKLVEGDPDMPMGVYISEIVCAGVKTLGALDFTKMKRSERRLVVHSAFYSDVLYLYIWIRIGALGHALRLGDLKCGHPGCRATVKDFTGDLRTLRVKQFEKSEERKITLDEGLEYARERRKVVRVGALRWAMMESGDAALLANPAKFKLATLQHGVIAIEGAPEGPVYLTSEHLRSMVPREVNQLVTEIDQCNGGAVMELEVTCPRGHTFTRALDWSYGSFFGPSSP